MTYMYFVSKTITEQYGRAARVYRKVYQQINQQLIRHESENQGTRNEAQFYYLSHIVMIAVRQSFIEDYDDDDDVSFLLIVL